MNAIWNFIVAHQVLCTLAAGYTWSAFISALPAPTANSSTMYKFWFSFFNYLAANIARARDTRVEGSPNFIDAVNLHLAQQGENKVVVNVPEPPKP